jgi:hypothetical protein
LKEERLSFTKKQFREIEISRARFLNNSVSALVGFVELNQNNEFGVVISVNGQTIFGGCPKTKDEFINNEPIFKISNGKDDVSLKSGVIKKSKMFHLMMSNYLLKYKLRKTKMILSYPLLREMK